MDETALVLLTDPKRIIHFRKLIDQGEFPESVAVFTDQIGQPVGEPTEKYQPIMPVFSTKHRAESYKLIHGYFTEGVEVRSAKLGALVTGIDRETLVLLNPLPDNKQEYDSCFFVLET